MAKDIAFKITVDSDVADLSIGELRQGFRQLQDEMTGVNTGTEEYRKRLLKLGEVKGALNDLKQQINALDPEKRFQAIAKIGSSVASGFAAAQGAVALFGSESEDLVKVLVRVQAATALAQGLQGLQGFGKAVHTAGLALKAFALSNPFTAIAVGVGVALALIAKFTDGLWGASKAYQVNVDNANKSLAIEQRKMELLSLQENSMRLAGKSEKEILQSKISQVDAIMAAAKISAIATVQQVKAQVEVAKRNKEILQGYITLVSAPLTLILGAIDLAGKALGKQFGLVDKFSGGLANMVFDPAGAAEAGLKTIQEVEKNYKELESQRAGFQIAIRNIDKKAADDNEDELKKARERIKKKLEVDYEAGRDLEQENIDNSLAIHLKGLQQAEADAEASAERQKEIERGLADFKNMVATESFKTIGDLALAFAGKTEASQRRAFAINKAAGIAQTVIDTYIAAQGAYKSQMVIPTPDAPVRAAVAAGIAIAQGLARVAIIAKTQFGSTGGGGNGPSPGGGSAPSIQSPQSQQNAFTTQSTSVNQNQSGQFTGFGPIKAYVLETEISDSQSTIRSIQERTTY